MYFSLYDAYETQVSKNAPNDKSISHADLIFPPVFQGNIISTLHLKEAGGKLFIDGVIFGLHHDDKPHLHGFHIHEYGKVGSRCLDAGAHFNPQGVR